MSKIACKIDTLPSPVALVESVAAGRCKVDPGGSSTDDPGQHLFGLRHTQLAGDETGKEGVAKIG